MDIHSLINETITKIQSGESLSGSHYLLALAGLAQLGVNENKAQNLPIDSGRFYSDLQNTWDNLNHMLEGQQAQPEPAGLSKDQVETYLRATFYCEDVTIRGFMDISHDIACLREIDFEDLYQDTDSLHKDFNEYCNHSLG